MSSASALMPALRPSQCRPAAPSAERTPPPVAEQTPAPPPPVNFDELYSRYSRMVHGVLVSRVPYGEVEDLLQETMLRAFQAYGQLRDPSKVGGWLATIARNLARNHLRDRGHVCIESLPPDVLDKRDEGDRAQLNELYRALRELPEAYRETLTLRLVEEMGATEIAELTGMQPGSVRVNLHRGMRILRDVLSRNGMA